MKNKTVGKMIRVEWDQDHDIVRLVIEITDPDFKQRVIHGKDFEDIISIMGKNIISKED